MKLAIFALSAVSAAAVDRCRNQADGTRFADPEDPHGYIECKNGESVAHACSNPDWWYNNTLLKCIEEKAMCNAPNNFNQKYYQKHSYKNGIYYMTYMEHPTAETDDKMNNWEALFYCSIMNSYVAMPYETEEYDMVVALQEEYLDDFHPRERHGNYELFMGIVGANIDHDVQSMAEIRATEADPENGLGRGATWHYFNKDRHWDNVLDFTRGPECTACKDWWARGYPTTDKIGVHANEKHVVQVNGSGMKNVLYNYEAHGVNCMYVCPQRD